MNNFYKSCIAAATALSLIFISTNANAQNPTCHSSKKNAAPTTPISIMGEHTHSKGKWMFSYNFERMHMQGNLKGSSSISPETIVTTISNPNAPPSTLRVVPTQMDMDMHMFGAMYGLTDKLTVMAMAMYMQKEMDHITFSGMSGTTRLGHFTTRSSGWGDTSLTGIYNIHKAAKHNINISLGVSVPTGSIKEEDDVLTPSNTRPTLRLPYSMQLGSGTWDALAGITYSGHSGKFSWGGQYSATIRLESENSQGYQWGDKHKVTGWSAYKYSKELSFNALASFESMEKIKGADANISAPVQTADPDNYGGKVAELGGGFTYSPDILSLKGLVIGAQVAMPVYQDLNGVQMKRDWRIRTGLRYQF